MKIIRKIIAAFAIILIAGSSVYAQAVVTSDNDSSKPENIIITKKNPVKEKVTIVIDGNDVTVNGKPIDDFVSNDIDIKKSELPDMRLDFSDDNVPMVAPPVPGHIMMNDQLRNLHNQMKMHINSNNAFLGVMSEKVDEGAKIKDVTKASAAEKAGLKTGDIITKINDSAVSGPDDLYKIVGNHKPNDKITITYLHNGKTLTTQATLGKQNQMRVYSWNAPDAYKNYSPHSYSFSWDDDKPRLGITAQDMEEGNGVKVSGIDDENGVAAKAGLKEDDIITQINGKAINSTDDLKESMKDVKKGDMLKVTFKRNNQVQTVDIKFPKELKTIDL